MIPKELEQYIEQMTSKEDSFLQQVNRNTHLSTLQPHMISGHFQGVLLEMISKSICPRRILEIGTFTGYSAICLAKGLAKDGLLHTIDIDEELAIKTKETFAQSGLQSQIIQHIGDAKDIIPQLEESFDLIFIDADKSSYAQYYELAVDKVCKNGSILVDNVLWKGEVLNNDFSKKAKIMHDFNQMVTADNRVQNILLPIRDGLMWIIKK